MKKPSKAQKKEFIAAVRAMKEPKPGRGGVGRSGAAPKSKRVPNADGPGGALP